MDPDRDAPALSPRRKPPLKERLSALFAEYGKIAIATYFTLSILTIIGFSVVFGLGLEPSGATGVLGVIAAGWVAAKATLPIRVLITLGLTPGVAWVVRRWWPVQPDADGADAVDGEATRSDEPPPSS